ncbi:hypothetical protein WJT86_06115 [Microvirga sp. W0021]|uniref:SnoaL-like domain-containing protein n=1 Tax=Hohaiivirga grylli TaxID=3133970 RepID=A0ABV0BI53_9HYPH
MKHFILSFLVLLLSSPVNADTLSEQEKTEIYKGVRNSIEAVVNLDSKKAIKIMSPRELEIVHRGDTSRLEAGWAFAKSLHKNMGSRYEIARIGEISKLYLIDGVSIRTIPYQTLRIDKYGDVFMTVGYVAAYKEKEGKWEFIKDAYDSVPFNQTFQKLLPELPDGAKPYFGDVGKWYASIIPLLRHFIYPRNIVFETKP